MKKPDTSVIDQPWPENELEQVYACPYCGSKEQIIAYKDVQDWSFYSAPGKWTYWDCKRCEAVYLSPRPTEASIGKAYASYYTHARAGSSYILDALKDMLRNECLSFQLNIDIKPRLHIPRIFGRLVSIISKRIKVPSFWGLLATLPKGRFLDFGCGSGTTVGVAQQLGWDAMGLDIDPIAIQTARQSGLNVVEGGYEKLAHYEQQFDCILCWHVIEHVHNPKAFLENLKFAIKPGGLLLLSLPNSLSALRYHFGENWRGLEAPRHIGIPSEPQLRLMLEDMGFLVQSMPNNQLSTAVESFCIQRRGISINKKDVAMTRQMDIQPLSKLFGNDIINMVCIAPKTIINDREV